MGYSTPKKQLDLKEFLSQPAQKRPFKRTFGKPSKPKPVDQAAGTGDDASNEQAAE